MFEPQKLKNTQPLKWIPVYMSSKQKDKSHEWESKKLKSFLDRILYSQNLNEEEQNQLHNLLISYDLNKRSNQFGCKWDKKFYITDSWDGSGYIQKNGQVYLLTNKFTFDPPPDKDYYFDEYKYFGEYIQWTPLQHYLNIKNCPQDLFELLLSYGARVDIPDITGNVFQLPNISGRSGKKKIKITLVPSKFFHAKDIYKVMNDISFNFK